MCQLPYKCLPLPFLGFEAEIGRGHLQKYQLNSGVAVILSKLQFSGCTMKVLSMSFRLQNILENMWVPGHLRV